VHEQMAIPFKLGDHQISTSTSIGIAFSSTSYSEPGDILRDADIAMYQAKARGKGCHVIFETGMHARAVSVLQRESELRRAVHQGEFKLLYQPIIDMSTGRAIACEALLRWEHPQEGLVSPKEFLPVAEETGLIMQIGQLALAQACEQLHRWQSDFGLASDFAIHLNLSAKEFCHRGLVQQIADALSSRGLDSRGLALEVGEQVLLEHPVLAAVMLGELHELGVNVSVNDFGSGFSSLRALRHFSVDALKLDRSFIHSLGLRQQRFSAIVKSIIELAESLSIDLVAVGVEDECHHDQLLRLGCRHGQGDFFYPPLEPAAMGVCLQ
jgi:EAL domain-containing protein (putative c-di-GMP-specific phosphodiesterase class I)